MFLQVFFINQKPDVTLCVVVFLIIKNVKQRKVLLRVQHFKKMSENAKKVYFFMENIISLLLGLIG